MESYKSKIVSESQSQEPLDSATLASTKLIIDRSTHILLAGEALIRLPQVLALIPVSRSSWYTGIQKKIYPPGIRISSRTTAWRVRDIAALLIKLRSKHDDFQ